MKKLLLLFALLLSTALTHAAVGDGSGIYLVGTFNYNDTETYKEPVLQFKETATPYLYLIEVADVNKIDTNPGQNDNVSDDNVISIEGNGNTVDNFRFVSQDGTTISLGSNGNKLVKDAAYPLQSTTDNIYTGNVNGSDKWNCTHIFLYYNETESSLPTVLFTDKTFEEINLATDMLIYSGNFVDIYARGSLNNWGNDGRLTSEYQFMETDVPNVYVWQRQDGSKISIAESQVKIADSNYSAINLGGPSADTYVKEVPYKLTSNYSEKNDKNEDTWPAPSAKNMECARVFLYWNPNSNLQYPKVVFTDKTLEEVLAIEDTPLIETKKNDIYLCQNNGTDLFDQKFRFQFTETDGVYEIVNEAGLTITNKFKITIWVDNNGDGAYQNSEAWDEMNLGKDIKDGNLERELVLDQPFALVSGNNPDWIKDNNKTITFKKAIFVNDPLFPSLYLTNDINFTWKEGTISPYVLCGGYNGNWNPNDKAANHFVATKIPGVYECQVRFEYTAGSNSKSLQVKTAIEGGNYNSRNYLVFGADPTKADGAEPVYLNTPYSMTVGADEYNNRNQTIGEMPANMWSNETYTVQKAFLYYADDIENSKEVTPILYLVSDVNFSARPIETLTPGFPINLFMRSSDLPNDGDKDALDARHIYQFRTTDQPNMYVIDNDYTINGSFRIGPKGASEPWLSELGDVENSMATIKADKTFGMSNNSASSHHTPVTTDGEIAVKKTVLYYDGSAIPKIILSEDDNLVPSPDPTYVGRSLYGLQVWQDAQYTNGGTQAAWDSSGGLYKCFTANQKDAKFMSDYLMNVTDASDLSYIQKMIMFYGPVNDRELLNDDNYKHLYTESQFGGKVYVIDFTQDYTAAYNAANGTGVDTNGDNVDDTTIGQGDKGIYVKVPRMSEKDDASYAAVPEHFRTGVRFTLFNYNYVPKSLTDSLNERKFVKYGHAFRLNEHFRALRGKLDATYEIDEATQKEKVTNFTWTENTGGFTWKLDTDGNTFTRTAVAKEPWNNGEAPTTSAKVANQKIGDNRLLSEYNFYLYRIILEVVNDGKNQDEQLFIRFEGRYDLEGKLEAKRTYYFSYDQGENGVSTEPNIFIGTEFTGRDRAFTRYHSNRDRSLLGNITDEELNELIAQGMYPDLNMGYSATSTYTFYDAAGNEISAFDNNRLYYEGFVNSNVKDADNRVIADDAATVNENAKYATSTREFSDVQGSVYNKTFFFDPAMETGVPTSYEVSTEYKFYDQEFNPGPYVTTGNFSPELGFEANPELKAEKKQRGSGDYEGWYNSTLTITPGQATHNGKTLPVTRYTITQHDTSVNQPVYAESYVNNSDDLTDWAKGGVTHDATNKDTRLVLDNVWITYEAPQTSIVPAAADEVKTALTQKLGNGVTETTIQYDLTQHYTVGLPQGLYTLDQISTAGLLSEELTADNSGDNTATKGGVVYKLQDVTGRATATATFLESDNNTTGIDSVGYDNVEVTVDGNAIVILGTDAEAAIYNTSGQAIYIGTDRRIEVVQGVYIVNVAGKVKKVAVL